MLISLPKMQLLTQLVILALIAGSFCGEYFYSNGTKYFFSAPMKKNWYQAQRFCHANGMHMATVHTEEENRILLDVIFGKYQPGKTDDHFWTSGTDMGQNDLDFYWTESGHAALYTNWIDGHPVKDRKGCILLHTGVHKYKWFDEPCENTWYFICQSFMFTPDATKRYLYNSSHFDIN